MLIEQVVSSVQIEDHLPGLFLRQLIGRFHSLKLIGPVNQRLSSNALLAWPSPDDYGDTVFNNIPVLHLLFRLKIIRQRAHSIHCVEQIAQIRVQL